MDFNFVHKRHFEQDLKQTKKQKKAKLGTTVIVLVFQCMSEISAQTDVQSLVRSYFENAARVN